MTIKSLQVQSVIIVITVSVKKIKDVIGINKTLNQKVIKKGTNNGIKLYKCI